VCIRSLLGFFACTVYHLTSTLEFITMKKLAFVITIIIIIKMLLALIGDLEIKSEEYRVRGECRTENAQMGHTWKYINEVCK